MLVSPWLPISVLIGFLFIIFFFVIARSSSEAGISITTVASKMSVVFPISFSIILDASDKLSLIKALAIIATVMGVLFTIYKPGIMVKRSARLFIPLLLFIGLGLVDSLVKYAQHVYIRDEETALFTAVLFVMAFLTGVIIIPFRRKKTKEFKSSGAYVWGTILGIVNLGSIYMLISALNHVNQFGTQIDSSIIFGANNIGIVSLSVISGMLFFKEKLLKINWIGIAISMIAIVLFSIS